MLQTKMLLQATLGKLIMSKILIAALLAAMTPSMAITSDASAKPMGGPIALADEVEMGRGALCDTQKHAERLASLVAEDSKVALETVNSEEHATACEYLNVAFVRGSRVGVVGTNGVTLEIVEVLVVGVVIARGVRPARPEVFFSLFKVDETAA